MTRAIIFDLDGTLLNTLDDLAAATNWALAHNGMPTRSIDEVRRFVGNGVRVLIQRAVPDNTDAQRLEKTFSDFKHYYMDHCQDKTCLYPGVADMLCTLKAQGFRMAIVSNKLQAGVDELYQRYFQSTIQVAIGERPPLRRKPAPDMVDAALQALGVPREEAVYVGDSDVDLATAKSSGLPCISVLWGFRSRDFLAANGATTFAATPADVLHLLHPRAHVTLITGGQRSGKSAYAERLALALAPNPVYMATAHIWDEEFRQRVAHHQQRRGSEWTNIEEERWLSRHDLTGRVVLVDCLTLWATNFFYSEGEETDTETALQTLCEEYDRLTAQDATFIIVTNEIGSGGTPVNAVQRRFTDLLGWLNQYVAAQADEVIMMVSGIPMTIKQQKS